jgi:hypothetical protein
MKETVIFFSRMGLVHIYGPIHKELCKTYNVFHIAYSQKESDILKKDFDILVDAIFLDEVSNQIKNRESDEKLHRQIDEEYIKLTNNRFNLNSALISDRGFKYLTYAEALHLAQSYYLFWSDFLNKQNKFVLFHETTSLLFNHICSMQCQNHNGIYAGFIGSKGLSKHNFRFVEFDTGESLLLRHKYSNIEDLDENLKKQSQDFIERHRKSAEKMSFTRKSSLVFDFIYASHYLLKRAAMAFSSNKLNKIVENTDFYMYKNLSTKIYFNRLIYRMQLKYDDYSESDKFLFYPMHVEPEAVVQYWSAGIYTNQVFLIEQIARNLPVGYILYVKDHVDIHGYRNISDYRQIKQIPNVKLIDPSASGLSLAKRSEGIVTINGTLGFEGLMLAKPVYILGSVYYDCFKNIIKIKNLKELRVAILKPYIASDEDLVKFVAAYLTTAQNGNIGVFFTSKTSLTMENNELEIFKNIFKEYVSDVLQMPNTRQ